MFDNILASTYKFYGRFKNEDPYIASIFYLYISQLALLFGIATAIKNYYSFDIISVFGSKGVFVGVSTVYLILMFFYYTRKRVNRIVADYEFQSRTTQVIWGVVAWASFLAPVGYFLFQ
jgi:hypothetical protein